MEIDVKMYPEKICRTCLCESVQLRLLSSKIEGENRTILDLLSFVANMNIIVGNNHPKHVCNACEALLYKADAFKRRCIESERIISQQIDGLDPVVNIEKKELIKDEKTLELDSLGLIGPPETSGSSAKATNSNLQDIFVDVIDKDHKNSFFTKSKQENAFIDDSKESIRMVKQEDDFDIQNDDYECHENETRTLPIEFEKKVKSSSKEIKIIACNCGTVFNKRDDYKSHMKTKKCMYKKTVKIKMEKKNPKGGRNILIKQQITCPECNLEFTSVKACKLHRKKHLNTDETGNFECSQCLRKFSRKSSYTNHIKQHDLKSQVKYTCDTCKREFQHKAHLDNHILNVHTRDKGFVCDICLVSFSTGESLEIHKDSHKTEKKHQCNFCKKAFYMLSTLNDHVRVHTGEKPYLCSICGKGFSQKTNLAQHVRRHQGLKPFKCEECERRFVSKGELVAHTRKHSGAHPFVCDDCGSGFTTSSSLVKHRRVHTGERPYQCDLCPMAFAASGTLKNHRRTHTGEKPFQCSYCEKAFVQRQDLVSHIRGHTGERPYTCQCGQSFRKTSGLKAHMKLHGKDSHRELSLLQPPAMLLGVPMPSGPPPTV